MKETRYRIYERFYSFQGEGVHLGRAACFIRLYGCDQHCPFCDSAGTWAKNFKPPEMPLLSAQETAALVEAPAGAFVVITGGEPALYDLEPLVDAIHARGFKVHLETAGHRHIRGQFDWVTMSPKLFALPPLESSWLRADEIKLIIESPEQLQRDLKTVLAASLRYGVPVWLHPEWSQRANAGVLAAIVGAAKENPRLRAGYQLHKLYTADLFDPNANQEIIPLGGKALEPGVTAQ
jgi:organic radical activating enzyme